MFVPYSLFYKIEVTLERQLRRLHVSTETVTAFTRLTNFHHLDHAAFGYLKRLIATPILLMQLQSFLLFFLPRIRDKE